MPTHPILRSLTLRAPVTAGAVAALLLATLAMLSPSASAAQPPVGLGTAGSFAVLAGSGITNTGPTTIYGDIGTFPTPSVTGFGSMTLTGTNHAGDAVTQGAKPDLQTAYDDAAGRNPVTNVPVELGGTTLLPGVYVSGTLGLTGTLTLDALGDPDATFVFKAASTLITASNSRVTLLNGANPCRVVWQVGSSATFGTGTQFVGDVLSHTSITAQTAATFRGRLLALNGAVTLDTNTITRATCATTPGGGGTTTTTATTGDTTATTTEASSTGGPGGGPGGPGGPTDTPRVGSPRNGPEAPFRPGAPATPATPATPDRPFLPFTGAEIAGFLAVAAALVTAGAALVRRSRSMRPAHG